MSDSVLIVLVIAVAVVVILFMLRKRITLFEFQANKDGLQSKLKAPPEMAAGGEGRSASPPSPRPGSVRISRNWLVGSRNRVDVGRGDVEIDRNKQLGRDESIVVRPDPQRDQV
jgi:hypothetical protein